MFGIDKAQKIVDYANFDISQLGDAFLFGGTMLLIGMLTIFSVLSLLWLCLTIFKYVFANVGKAKENKNAKVEAPAAPVVVPKKNDDSEIVAVIAAAIAMAESENSDMKFRVVSFKRK